MYFRINGNTGKHHHDIAGNGNPIDSSRKKTEKTWPSGESVDEFSRPESPASIAIKSLELDGAKAGDLKIRVEANERALDDLQKVQSKAGNIANMAAEGDFPFGGDQSVVTVKPLPRSSTAASVVP